MELEFGKKVKVGNFNILKFSKSLSKSELRKLRSAEKIPAEVQKYLNRASLPYIKVSTLSESWSVEFVCGTVMFNALNALNVVMDGDGNRQLYGVEAKNTEAILVAMFADTTTIGDFEYQAGKQKLLTEYLARASKAANEKADEGKTDEELEKESGDAVQDVIDRDEHACMILDMAGQIKKEEQNHDEQHGQAD